MTKPTTLMIAGGLCMALAGPALAQTTAGKPANDIVLPDRSMRASKMIGATVYQKDHQPIGTVVDLLLKRGVPVPTVVLSVGDYLGTGPKLVAVPMTSLHMDGAMPVMPTATKETLARMPVFLFPPTDTGSG